MAIILWVECSFTGDRSGVGLSGGALPAFPVPACRSLLLLGLHESILCPCKVNRQGIVPRRAHPTVSKPCCRFLSSPIKRAAEAANLFDGFTRCGSVGTTGRRAENALLSSTRSPVPSGTSDREETGCKRRKGIRPGRSGSVGEAADLLSGGRVCEQRRRMKSAACLKQKNNPRCRGLFEKLSR